MQFGVCVSPALLFEHQEAGDLADFLAGLKEAGVNYLEFPVAAAAAPEPEWERLRPLMASSPLPVRAFNGFLPAAHRVTGPDVNLPSVLDFCRLALSRCRALGGEVIVLGSAGARRVPPGFDPQQAWEQFRAFCRALGPLADAAGMDIAIEPLNTQEDNLIVSVSQGARLVDSVAHPRIRLLADFYHMFVEQEPLEAVAQAGGRLRHTHLADLGRVAPGYAPDGEADFVGFFRALRASGYATLPDARCSFEGHVDDLTAQAPSMMRLLADRWQQSAHPETLPQQDTPR